MTLRKAMRALTDSQLHQVHTQAQDRVSSYLQGGHTVLIPPWSRQALAAEREILARGRHSRSAAS